MLQRVSGASVSIDGSTVAAIGQGLLILLGIEETDGQADIDYLVRKISQMRIFSDADGKMNLSLLEIEGEAIVVSQFTLFASTKKGNRPGFTRSAAPPISKPLYEAFLKSLSATLPKPVGHGEFGADMQVSLTNSGPVTIIIDSKEKA